MRSSWILAPALLAAATLVGCADEPTSATGGDARVVFASEFSFSGMAAGLPIEAIRLTPTFHPDGGAAGAPHVEDDFGPNDPTFEIDARIDLGGRDSALVVVLIEMLSIASGDSVVEWSAQVGPVHVAANEVTEEQTPVVLIRGPIENQFVDSIFVSGPEFMYAGTTHDAWAEVHTSGNSHTVVWSSSNEGVITVEPVGDTITLQAVGGGEAWVRGGAGMHTDSFQVFVEETVAGPAAAVVVYPDSATMIVGSTRAWGVFAFDSLGIGVSADIAWTSLDAGIATVSDAGVVSAQALGRARIVASADGIADTAIVHVQDLPEGVDLLWQGGVVGAETDWFTADNWSPARVPTASDVIYVPSGILYWAELTANAEVGGVMGDTLGGFSLDIGNNTLTVHGDVLAPYVYGDSLGRVVMTAANATIAAYYLPGLELRGNVTLVGDLGIYGDLVIDRSAGGTAHLELGSTHYAAIYGDLSVIDGSIGIRTDSTTFEESAMYVEGDALFDGGDIRTTFTGGQLDVGGDFTVTATSCNAFNPAGGVVELYSDTSSVSLGCPGRTSNHFHELWVYSAGTGQRVLELLSDVSVVSEFYFDAGQSRILGNGYTLDLTTGSAYDVTLDNAYIEITIDAADGYFYADSIAFANMGSAIRPQATYTHPGGCAGCYVDAWIHFDPTSSGPYLEVIDPVANGDSVVVYMGVNPGDGPARTVTTGEATVHWAGVPYYLFAWAGSGQTGPELQALPDSLMVQVVDFGVEPIAGTTVDWTVTVGDGSVNPTSSVTDAGGFAATQFTLGSLNFPTQEVAATIAALPADSAFFFGFPAPAGAPERTAAPASARMAVPTPINRPALRRPHSDWPTPRTPPTAPDTPGRAGERR